jgi:hypothetical protein
MLGQHVGHLVALEDMLDANVYCEHKRITGRLQARSRQHQANLRDIERIDVEDSEEAVPLAGSGSGTAIPHLAECAQLQCTTADAVHALLKQVRHLSNDVAIGSVKNCYWLEHPY